MSLNVYQVNGLLTFLLINNQPKSLLLVIKMRIRNKTSICCLTNDSGIPQLLKHFI